MTPALDWNDLRLAVALAELRTLTAAARRLGLHQATASRRLAALEASLGVPLFLRGAAGYTPTAAGKKLLASAAEFSARLDALAREGLDDHRAVRGVVRVAVTERLGADMVSRVLPALRREHPALCVELLASNLAADLARGEADLALRFIEPDASEYVRARLGTVRFGLYAAREYLARSPVSAQAAGDAVDALAGHEVVVPCGELARGPEARWLGEGLRGGVEAVRSNSMSLVLRAAEEGLGLGVFSDLIAHDRPRLVRVRSLPEVPARHVWLVYHRDAREVARVRAVAAALGLRLREKLRAAGGAKA